jgi:hypothetical protein
VMTRPPDLNYNELAHSIRLSPQDVLKLTKADGEANNGGQPVTGNVSIKLLIGSDVPPDVSSPAVWDIHYVGKEFLYILVDAQTGQILRRRT